jgi:membrane protein
MIWAISRNLGAFASRVARARIPLLAAGLAYYAAFSLFPLLLLAVAGFGFALGQNPALRQEVLGFFSSSIETAFPTAAVLLNQTLNDLKAGLLDRLQLNAGISGLIGLVALLWASSGFFTVLQVALNDTIPGVRSRPAWLQRLVGLGAVPVVGALLLVLMSSGVLASSLGALPGLGLVRVYTGAVLVFFGAALVFTLAFRFFPAHSPGWRASLLGGAVTALVWQLARSLLGALTPIATYQATYGVLAGFLLLLAWLYLSMQVFLLGAVLVGMLDEYFQG